MTTLPLLMDSNLIIPTLNIKQSKSSAHTKVNVHKGTLCFLFLLLRSCRGLCNRIIA